MFAGFERSLAKTCEANCCTACVPFFFAQAARFLLLNSMRIQLRYLVFDIISGLICQTAGQSRLVHLQPITSSASLQSGNINSHLCSGTSGLSSFPSSINSGAGFSVGGIGS